MALSSVEVFAFAERTLERRAIYVSIAPPIVKAAFALTVIFLIVGLVLLVGVIVALARARGYRAPYIALTIAAVCYVLNRLLVMVYYLLSFSDTANSITWVLTSNVASLWGGWTDVFVLLAVLLLIQNRANSLVSSHSHEGGGCGMVKKLGDWALVALMWLWVLVTTSVIASSNSASYHRQITSSEQRDRVKGAYAVRHLADVFNFFILVNIGISSLVLRSRIAKYNNARDKPTNAVAFIVFPVLVVHYFYRMYSSIQASSDFFGNTRSSLSLVKRNRILTLIGIFESSILIGVIFIVLAVNGFNRERWNTFGDIPVNATKPQWTGHQQQPMGMYQQQQQQQPYINGQVYPQQQQYVVGQVYPQPQPGIVYSQPQPTIAYAQPQPQHQSTPHVTAAVGTPVSSSPPVPAPAAPNVPQV